MKESKNKKRKSNLQKLAGKKGLYIALVSVLMMVGFYVYARNMRTSLEKDFVSFDENAWQEAVSESGIEVIDIDENGNVEKNTQKEPNDEKSSEMTDEKVNEVVQTSAETEPEFAMITPFEGEIIAECSLEELVFCSAMDDWRTHNGVDIAAVEGTPVKATEKGVVSKVYKDELLGVVVVVDHENGISSLYGNLQSVEFIEAGTRVNRGDIIGGVGKPGTLEVSSEPHLHFEVWANGEYENPREYVSF